MQGRILREVVVHLFAVFVELPHLHFERVLLVLVFLGLRVGDVGGKAYQNAEGDIFECFCHYLYIVTPYSVKFAAKLIQTRQIIKFNFYKCYVAFVKYWLLVYYKKNEKNIQKYLDMTQNRDTFALSF